MIQIKQRFRDLIPALSPDEFSQLEQNCILEGIRDAIVTWQGFIVDGHNRYEIAQKNALKYRTEEREFEDENAAKVWMIRNQFGRRNLSAYVRATLALNLESLFAEKAKENQGARNDLCLNSDKGQEPIDTKKELARIAGTGHDTIAKVKKIQAKASEDEKQRLSSGLASINEVYQGIRKEEKRQDFEENIKRQKEEIFAGVPNADGLFDVISVDPPWPYGREYDPETSRVVNPYPEMSIEEITGNTPPFSDDSVCLLWTTHRFLPDAFEILKAWGFDYKATIVWDKENMGMGAWLRMQCEFVLVGIKGGPIWHNTTERDIIREKRREHSRKPTAFFEVIDKICVGRKLEFYSREQRAGWDSFGNDTSQF